MPACRRCERVQATAELRRNGHGGYVCKENTRGSRCWTIARDLAAAARSRRRAARRAQLDLWSAEQSAA